MVILGLILLLVALGIGAVLIIGTQAPHTAKDPVDIRLLDTVTVSLDPLMLVLAGMATMFLFWLGLVLIKTSLARKQRLRRERKQQERDAQERQSLREREIEDERGRDHERPPHDRQLSTGAPREHPGVGSGGDARTRPVGTRGRRGPDDVDRSGDTQRIDPREGRR